MKHGIRYTFVKEVDQVTVWKFKKNENLFLALAEFYGNRDYVIERKIKYE